MKKSIVCLVGAGFIVGGSILGSMNQIHATNKLSKEQIAKNNISYLKKHNPVKLIEDMNGSDKYWTEEYIINDIDKKYVYGDSTGENGVVLDNDKTYKIGDIVLVTYYKYDDNIRQIIKLKGNS